MACRVGHGHGEALLAVGDGEGFEIDGDFGARVGLDEGTEGGDVFPAATDTGHAESGGVAEEDFSKGLRDDGPVSGTVDRLRCVLARGATAEV